MHLANLLILTSHCSKWSVCTCLQKSSIWFLEACLWQYTVASSWSRWHISRSCFALLSWALISWLMVVIERNLGWGFFRLEKNIRIAPEYHTRTLPLGGLYLAQLPAGSLQVWKYLHRPSVTFVNHNIHLWPVVFKVYTHKWPIRKRLRWVFANRLVTCSFQAMHVTTNKMTYQKDTTMSIWTHNSPFVPRIQFYMWHWK